MSLIGNILWLVFGGLIAGCLYILSGLLLCLTIVGIPFGLQTIKIGWATFAPFGKDVVTKPGGDSVLSLVFNIIWILCFGWEIAIAHLTSAALLAITIIGLPFAKQHLKLLVVSFLPFGHELK
ncbi:YccF domain-containing protein [Lyngbya confervoides]|uniref:YccF domain-containing protein n=1 Tax=Lyngbya confervoides BDU141951 TaxID=1574623 RepID=A0ABD4T299_9CYAN|nr:YccF domain-containing protein [Lyngbya confervoides]MCM1982362.1 YccF domain-containing protein [Lyngbya confervoides BDU141951]